MHDLRRFLDIVLQPVTEGVKISNSTHMAAFAVAVAEAYDAAPRFVEADRKPWDILNQHNNEVLFKQMQNSGVQVSFTSEDPYDDGSGDPKLAMRRMLWDMTMHKRLKIWSGGSDDHPVFSPQDNVILRAVHDYYTHGKLRTVMRKQAQELGIANSTPTPQQLTRLLPNVNLERHGNVGHAFSLRGELNAFSSHRKLVPPAAAPAVFTEIIGQLCYNEIVGDFPQQKVVILRDFDYDRVGEAKSGTRAAQRMQQVMQLIGEGAESIQTSIKAKPQVVVAELVQRISRNGNTLTALPPNG